MTTNKETANDKAGQQKTDKTVMFADFLEAIEDHERLVELADHWNVK